jgi:hypothetical protein
MSDSDNFASLSDTWTNKSNLNPTVWYPYPELIKKENFQGKIEVDTTSPYLHLDQTWKTQKKYEL